MLDSEASDVVSHLVGLKLELVSSCLSRFSVIFVDGDKSPKPEFYYRPGCGRGPLRRSLSVSLVASFESGKCILQTETVADS